MIPNQCFPSWLSLSLPGVRREAMKVVITALLQLSLRHDPQAREHGQNSRPGSLFILCSWGFCRGFCMWQRGGCLRAHRAAPRCSGGGSCRGGERLLRGERQNSAVRPQCTAGTGRSGAASASSQEDFKPEGRVIQLLQALNSVPGSNRVSNGEVSVSRTSESLNLAAEMGGLVTGASPMAAGTESYRSLESVPQFVKPETLWGQSSRNHPCPFKASLP